MKPEDRIRKLISESSVRTSGEADKRILGDALEHLERSQQERSPDPPPNVFRAIFNRPTAKLAAAAVIIIAVLIVIHQFTGPVYVETPAFARMIEAMKKIPCAHAVLQMRRGDHEERAQFWYSFTSKVEASKEENGKLTFYDYSRQVAYAYDPGAEQVTIFSLGERKFALGAGSPWELMEKTVEQLSENEGVQVTRKSDEYNGRNVEIHKVRVPRKVGIEEWLFVADSDTHLIMTLKLRGYDPDGNVMVNGEIIFDYPDDGPADIYELGVPRSAVVIDDRTKPEAEEIFNTYKAYRQNAPSRYIVVQAHYNNIERIGAVVIDAVTRVYTDGRLQRSESYQPVDWLEYLDNWPKYSAQMGNTFDSQIKWWTQSEYSGCRLIMLYDNEYHYTVTRDLKTKRWSSKPPQHDPERNYRAFGLGGWGWPLSNLSLGVPGEPPITVLDNEYSKQNKLICLQRLWQGKVHKDSATLPCKRLWYLNPQRDYICQRFEEHYLRNAPWQKDKSWLEGVDPDRVFVEKTWIRQVTEFGQTDAGQWYAKRIGGNNAVIFLDTDPEFPEGIFDPENLPK
ncbi:MAG: hypothetical protein KAY65_06750 [Planctomycetes bacterium]|nr:hypothetical protein [Planctomycetota bacterium]